jgi:thiamine-monophosphate kinase
VDEFEIIRRYFQRETSDKDIRVGIGDDGAVLIPSPDRDLISVVDTLVSGIHFPETLAPEDIGYRAVAVNLSDVAAMGARPRWMTLALTLASSEPAWLDGFARGLFEAADEQQLALVGGDTTRGTETVISVQIIADIDPGKAMTRDGAQPGDAIYVTGTVGDAAAGLSILQSGLPGSDDVDYLIGRFSSVAGSIELADIPLSAHLTNLMDEDDALRFALGGGDDYELCFAASATEDKIGEISERTGIAITRIGQVAKGSGLQCTRNGNEYDYQDTGYRHFH